MSHATLKMRRRITMAEYEELFKKIMQQLDGIIKQIEAINNTLREAQL